MNLIASCLVEAGKRRGWIFKVLNAVKNVVDNRFLVMEQRAYEPK